MIKAYKSILKEYIELTQLELSKQLGNTKLNDEERVFINGQLDMLEKINEVCVERGRY